MDRNSEQYFMEEPTIDIQRSTLPRRFSHKTTLNSGKLVPFYVDTDILPAMTIKNKTTILLRLSTPEVPTMDNCYADTYWFFIPNRQLWEHWKAFNGENETAPWTQTVEYLIPKFKTDTTHTVSIHTFNAYAGIPQSRQVKPWNKFGVRAYIRTWNYWFRDQNLMAPIPMDVSDGDTVLDGTIATGDDLLPVCKFHDYFTSALPEPQKGSAVTMPLGTTAPVIGNGKGLGLDITIGNGTKTTGTLLTNHLTGDSHMQNYPIYDQSGNALAVGTTGTPASSGVNRGTIGVTINPELSGLVADLTEATAATINALRLSVATQRILERDARFGTRYHEYVRAAFGVSNPDLRMQIPEYLGGHRFPISIEQITQTSSTDTESPIGYTGATSLTVDINNDFTKSFTEHGVLLGMICIRTNQSYQYGVARQWTRERRLDYYDPALSHISNMPIYNYEIYSDGSNTDDEVFGYKEAWAEYKYKNSLITGELSSLYTTPLDSWHYAEEYTNCPVLSDQWIINSDQEIDRTILVTSHDQFIMDAYVDQIVRLPMPTHCVPGLMDHF